MKPFAFYITAHSGIVWSRRIVQARRYEHIPYRDQFSWPIAVDSHVIRPGTKLSQGDMGHGTPNLRFLPTGIGQASTGQFACRVHDDTFRTIDHMDMDFHDPKTLNMLCYRAVLRELWQLFRMERATSWLERRMRLPGPLSGHPDNRKKALHDLAERLRLLVYPARSGHPSPVVHIVRRFKSDQPIVAASCAGGGSNLAIDRNTGRGLSQDEIQAVTGLQPNTSWAFTVIPQRNEHVIVASWLKDSAAEHYFRHFNELHGRELQAAVSAELIYFGENWFLHPTAWESYGEAKQLAILRAYDNFLELQSGQYRWWDRGDIPWYDYLRIPNRHQINLFRYRQSIPVA